MTVILSEIVAAVAFWVWLYIAIIVHELGHYCAAKMLGVMTSHVEIGTGNRLFGFELCNDNWRIYDMPLSGHVVVIPNSKWWKMLVVYISGPLATLTLAVIAYFAIGPMLGLITLVSMVNLIPFKGSDGEGIKRALARRKRVW